MTTNDWAHRLSGRVPLFTHLLLKQHLWNAPYLLITQLLVIFLFYRLYDRIDKSFSKRKYLMENFSSVHQLPPLFPLPGWWSLLFIQVKMWSHSYQFWLVGFMLLKNKIKLCLGFSKAFSTNSQRHHQSFKKDKGVSKSSTSFLSLLW